MFAVVVCKMFEGWVLINLSMSHSYKHLLLWCQQRRSHVFGNAFFLVILVFVTGSELGSSFTLQYQKALINYFDTEPSVVSDVSKS